MLYAPQEQAKTFLGLDIALSVGSGTLFHGHKVKQGPVVYILGEGRGGLKKRISAWMKQHQLDDIKEAFFVLEGVQFHRKEDVVQLRTQIEALGVKPAMIFIDTFARCAVGVEENEATQVGQWIDAVGTLQNQLQVDVVALHHAQKGSGKKDPRERGSTAFIGAVDTVLRIKKSLKVLTVSCEKQKDAEHFASFTLHMKVVETGTDHNGDVESSCVLVSDGEQPPVDSMMMPDHRRMLEILARFEHSAKRKDWLAQTGLSDRTFDRHREELQAEGYIQPGGSRGAYTLADKGAVAIAKESPTPDIGKVA
jgi:hypothetical protein